MGKGEARGAEVDAGHRRRQTGSNWREPASPMINLSMEGKLGELTWSEKEEENIRERETWWKSGMVHANKFRTSYIACSRVAPVSIHYPGASIGTHPPKSWDIQVCRRIVERRLEW